MRLVILESPYGSPDPQGVEENVLYARRCVTDCLKRGEAPIASHLLFTQPGILDDKIPSERALGIEAGLAWYIVAELCVVYVDRGISSGMRTGIGMAMNKCVFIEYRSIDGLKGWEINRIVEGDGNAR